MWSRCRRGRWSVPARARPATAASSDRASAGSPRPCSRSERERAQHRRSGSRRRVPAMSGAEPCTGSKIPGFRVAEARRGGEPEPAGHPGGDVGEDVAEHVLHHEHVEGAGVDHDLHGDAVDEAVAQLDIRVLRREPGDDSPPHARGVEHVRPCRRRAGARTVPARARTLAARSARPARGGTRRCRTRCRPRGPRARRSRGRRRARGRSAGRRRCRAPAAGSRTRRAPCAGRSARPRVAREHCPTGAHRPRRAAPRPQRGTPRASAAAAGGRTRRSRRRRRGARRSPARAAAPRAPDGLGRHLGPDPVAREAGDAL